jgi:hypothetical protein
MGVYDKFADSPNAIRIEGQEITLRFQRTSDTTGRISWNIPAPAAGCNADTQAYDGIVLTVASKPANYLTTSPKDGVYYTGDATVDTDVHAGDKLDVALIVGAFYNNKTTTFLDLTDLTPRTAYYVSGYAVDKVARYHREGVHAYSLPSGPQEPNSEKDLVAVADIGIDTSTSIAPTDQTGLSATTTYVLTLIINGKSHTFSVYGGSAQTYDQLLSQINQQLITASNPDYTGTSEPHAGEYYVNETDQLVSQWNGHASTALDVYFSAADPSSPVLDTYWFNLTSSVLKQYETAGWITRTFKSSAFDFANPQCYAYWYDGTNVYKWEKVLWCQLPTYSSAVNPLTAPTLDCNTFWYDISTHILGQWNIQTRKWDEVSAIYTNVNPNSITSGAYWFNQTDEKLYYFSGSTWNLLTHVTYAAQFTGATYPNNYWFNTASNLLYRRDAGNLNWVELDVILYPTDPRDRASCQLWWNSDTDALKIWNVVNSVWVSVSHFYDQALDPSTPQDIPLNSAWYNSTTHILTIINNPDCTTVDYVFSSTDPRVVTTGQIWHDTANDVWKKWDGSAWIEIQVISKTDDPYILSSGEFWFDTPHHLLKEWSGSTWNALSYTDESLVPDVGTTWYDTTAVKLKEWNGVTWVETIGIAAVKLILRNEYTCDSCVSPVFSPQSNNDGFPLPRPMDIIRFYTKGVGCKQRIEICFDGGTAYVFGKLKNSVVYFEPQNGYTALPSGPMYKQVGVGTDGSPDERRELQSLIRSTLGDPATKVELTKEQLDLCIDNALIMLRKRSSLAYKRAMFFLDVHPNQQLYLLKDKCVGFNKIVDVTSIHRMRAGFWSSSGFGGDNLFGIAALQNLYRAGGYDLLSYHLMSSWIEELQYLFADNVMYNWYERERELRVYQTFAFGGERILLDSVVERTEQDLITNRETAAWIRRWSIAEAKMMLSQVRGKFQTLPGPNGNTTLNASELATQATDEMTALQAELDDFFMQGAEFGMRGHFLIG